MKAECVTIDKLESNNGRDLYKVRLGTKLESFVRVAESYFVRCLQSFRVVDSPVVLPSREYFASWRDKTFSCRRVCSVFSCRISVRVVVHVIAVTNCDQRSIQIVPVHYIAHTPCTYHHRIQRCPARISVNSLQNDSVSVDIRMIKRMLYAPLRGQARPPRSCYLSHFPAFEWLQKLNSLIKN